MSPQADGLNIINLSHNGTFKVSSGLQTHPRDVDAIFEHLLQNNVEHLLLYFHGGRVSEQQGKRTADDLMPLFQERVGAHPIFFIWESSELEVINHNLERVRHSQLFQQLLDAVLTFVLGKLQSSSEGRGGLGGLEVPSDAEVENVKQQEFVDVSEVNDQVRHQLTPVTDEEALQFEHYLEADPEFQAQAVAIAEAVLPSEHGRGLGGGSTISIESSMLSHDVIEELKWEEAQDAEGRGLISVAFFTRSAAGVFRRVIARMVSRTDHGLYCTAVEEILRQFYLDKVGGWIWDQMKTQIASAFGSNIGLAGEGLHGGTYFIERLRDYLAATGGKRLKVSLVGHSAGSIYICHFLAKAFQLLPHDFKFYRVVFLAPAVDFDVFKTTVVDHAQRLNKFRMYSMRDQHEARDVIVPLIYPRSLLYFVSGVLEGSPGRPLLGMERFYSGQPPYDSQTLLAVREFVYSDADNRVVWAVANESEVGLNSCAIHHSGFVNDLMTQQSLEHLLRT